MSLFFFLVASVAASVDEGEYNEALESLIWTIESETGVRIPSMSTQRHRYSVEVVDGDEAADPTDYTLQVAYYTDRSVDPDTLTWYDLSWDDNNRAYLVVGPDDDSQLYLAPGSYFRAIRTKARPRFVQSLPIVNIEKPAGR